MSLTRNLLRTSAKLLSLKVDTLKPTQTQINLFDPMKNENDISDYFKKQREMGKKVIPICAKGGGNDNLSALHLGKYLKEFHGFKIIFFGVLGFTPYHTNSEAKGGLENEEKVFLATKNMKRFIMVDNLHQINNNEKEIPEILEQQGLSDCPYYLFSSKYTPQEIAQAVKIKIDYELNKMGLSENDLLILASDYGGDVLGHDLSTYSPDLDAFSARMIQSLNYSAIVPKLSLILWPGVDGELSKEALLKRFQELGPSILAKSNINDKSPYFETLVTIYDQIKKSRPGNTIPNVINILRHQGTGDLNKSLTSRTDREKKYTIQEARKLDITEDLVRTATLLPLAAIISINPFAQIEDQQDLFAFFIKVMDVYNQIKLERSSKTGVSSESKSYPDQERTDFHMQYLRLDDQGLWTSKNTAGKLAMQILISPTSYTDTQNNCLLEGGLKNIQDGTVDIALVLTKQFGFFKECQPQDTLDIATTDASSYQLLWKKSTENPQVVKEVTLLKERMVDLKKPKL